MAVLFIVITSIRKKLVDIRKPLFEKLTLQEKPFDLRASVMRQIQMILSARGKARNRQQEPTLLDFGIPPVVDQMGADSDRLREYQQEIRRMILAFEPRVRDVEVRGSHAELLMSIVHLKVDLQETSFEEDVRFGESANNFEVTEGKVA